VLLMPNLTIQMAIAILVAVLVGMTLHEFAHNYVAHLMGDPTPARLGRLTLNPLVHIFWPGFLMFVVLGFGILGFSAPIDPYRMRNPRWGYLAAIAAGPLSNLLLAVVAAIFLRFLNVEPFRLFEIVFQGVTETPLDNLAMLFGQIVFWNVLTFVFNLLPFFPIDGWRMVFTLLPPDMARWWERNAQYSQYVLIGLIFIGFANIQGFDPLGTIISEPTFRLTFWLFGFPF
jgi:Zn-dependent protease